MSEKLQFRVSSKLKEVIGKDLITDDFVAVFELVKNSVDAFAEKTVIHFVLDDEQESKIYLVDNGKGMSKNDLINKWLFVAFSAKRDGTEDKVKKNYSGYKGIGRFSCDRIGRTLKIQARTKSDKNVHCIKVNWDDFEKNSKNEFININVDYSEEKSFSLPENVSKNDSGVVLEMGLLRNKASWSRAKLINLKRSLQKLIDPIDDKKVIEIKCNREIKKDKLEKQKAFEKKIEPVLVNGKIENTIFKALKNITTTLKAQITSQGLLQVELIDRGTFIYKTEENISEHYPKLIDSDFHAEISFLNRAAKVTFARRMNIRAVEYGSLFLLRNGFRLYPVGEQSNDYWGFARRKQQGYARYLGSRDLLGFVKISGEEDKFREASSRNQGLIQTKAAKELSECVKQCLVKLEAYVVNVTWKDKLDKDQHTSERMGLDNNRYRIIKLVEKLSNSKSVNIIDVNYNLVSILSEKAKEFEPSLKKLQNIATGLNNEELIKQISKAEKALIKIKIAEQEALEIAEKEKKAREKAEERAKEAVESTKTAFEEKAKAETAYEEEIKRNIFLTGSGSRDKELLEGFIHQIILYASHSKARLQNILKAPAALKKMSFKKIQELFEELFEVNEKIISTSRFATTANFRLKSSMISEDFNAFLKEYVEKIAVAYNSRIKIIAEIDPRRFELKFNPIEVGMALENFISNAKKARAMSISFTSTIKDNLLELTVEDNGRGLDAAIKEKGRIFEKGFTRTDGSGLGLYFCKNKIEALGGELKLSTVQPKRGTSFKIKVAK